jgi:hypothetical protein
LITLGSNINIIAAELLFVPRKGPGSLIDPPLFPERLAMIFQQNQGYATFFMEQRESEGWYNKKGRALEMP